MDLVYLGRYNESEILTGPEKVAVRIFYNYTKENKSVFFEYFFDGNEFGFFKKLFGKEKICEVNGSAVLRLGLVSLFIQLIKLKPKIIHIISFERFALIAFLYRVFFKVKIIYNVHGVVAHENKYFCKVSLFKNFKDCFTEDIIAKYSDIILLLSKSSKIILDKYYDVSKRKIKYITNGIDEEFKKSIDKKNVSDGKLKIVFISDIKRKEKGFGFLKDTLEEFDREIELHIVDKKKTADEISFRNKLINCYSYDLMTPNELTDFFADKDVFISSASYEPFGLTSVECMSAGLVPVLTSETGASGLITDELNGFVFEYGNSRQLIKILYLLIDNPEMRNKISLEASKMFELINWETVLKNYENVYNRILN